VFVDLRRNDLPQSQPEHASNEPTMRLISYRQHERLMNVVVGDDDKLDTVIAV